jgi:hypothetical protein
MSAEETPPTSVEELHAELKELLREAHSNGIDIRGRWECRNGGEYPDWDVLITEVQKSDDES